jgi:hypothetical protein
MESRAATIADPCSQRLYDGWGQLPSRAQGGLACSGKGGERGPRLSYLERNTQRLHVDRSNFFGGLPARAQIAAQLANIISAQTYALAVGIAPFIERSQLPSILLHSGVYNAGLGASSQTACCEARDGCWNEIPRRFRYLNFESFRAEKPASSAPKALHISSRIT